MDRVLAFSSQQPPKKELKTAVANRREPLASSGQQAAKTRNHDGGTNDLVPGKPIRQRKAKKALRTEENKRHHRAG